MSIVSSVLRKVEPWYCRWHNWRIKRWLLRNARQYPYHRSEFGITIVAGLENPVSLNKTMRDLAFQLKAAGIPFQAFSTNVRRLIPDEDVDPILTPKKEFRAARYSHVIEMNDSVFPAEELGVRRLTLSFWEFESGYFEDSQGMLSKRNIVAMSDFTASYFRKAFPKTSHVDKMLYPFRAPKEIEYNVSAVRCKFGIPDYAFAVLFNFDYGSGYHRKSPYAVARAFAKAFKDEEDAVLVMKTMQSGSHPDKREELVSLMSELGISDRCIFIDKYVSLDDLYALTQACDVYVSLHRGEGFGLGICEAMSMGKPVVVTNYSANTEYCNADNSILVPVTMVKPLPEQNDVPYYKHVEQWAEPDVDAAARGLRELYCRPDLRSKIGAEAKKFIAEHFSVENFRKSVEELIMS